MPIEPDAEALRGLLRTFRSLVIEGSVPRYTVLPGAALNVLVTEVDAALTRAPVQPSQGEATPAGVKARTAALDAVANDWIVRHYGEKGVTAIGVESWCFDAAREAFAAGALWGSADAVKAVLPRLAAPSQGDCAGVVGALEQVTDNLEWLAEFAAKQCEFEGDIEPVLASVAEARAALDRLPAAQGEGRSCTCHPDDRPEGACRERYAASECQATDPPARMDVAGEDFLTQLRRVNTERYDAWLDEHLAKDPRP